MVFLDPPYRDSFTNYSTGFNDDSQREMCAYIQELLEAGHRVAMSNRTVEGERFFEDLLGDSMEFHYFDVTYTAGRRKRTEAGFEAKPAREFLAVSR